MSMDLGPCTDAVAFVQHSQRGQAQDTPWNQRMDPYGLIRLCLIPSRARATGAAPGSAASRIKASMHTRGRYPLKCVCIGAVSLLSQLGRLLDHNCAHLHGEDVSIHLMLILSELLSVHALGV